MAQTVRGRRSGRACQGGCRNQGSIAGRHRPYGGGLQEGNPPAPHRERKAKKKLCRSDERSWGTGVCSFKGEEFEIVDLLSRDYAIRDICSLMGVSRSGYYKWKRRPPSRRDINREKMIELVRTVHEKHRTHGYRWTAAYIRINEHIDISESYAYKCFRLLGIKSETRHQVAYSGR